MFSYHVRQHNNDEISSLSSIYFLRHATLTTQRIVLTQFTRAIRTLQQLRRTIDDDDGDDDDDGTHFIELDNIVQQSTFLEWLLASQMPGKEES